MDADVVVVGAGPTGLLLAGDLAEAGVAVTVLERRAEESNLTRAFAVHARTMEQLEIRGVADELATTGPAIPTMRLLGRIRVRSRGLCAGPPWRWENGGCARPGRRLYCDAVSSWIRMVLGATDRNCRLLP